MGDLKSKVEEGENIWMSESEIRKIDHLFASFDEMVEIINGKNLVFFNRDRTVDSY
jgi:hypothetical protein